MGVVTPIITNGGRSCPFCREPGTGDDEKAFKRIMKRVKANDPAALCYMGTYRYEKGDHDSAVKYWTKAAELDDVIAHNQLGWMYWKGEGVAKDEKKSVYYLEKAAILGHPFARHNLGCTEGGNVNMERAVKHFIIAAKLGYEGSMRELWKHYSAGEITKEDLEATLRTNKAAIDAMKSPQREAAEAWRRNVARRG